MLVLAIEGFGCLISVSSLAVCPLFVRLLCLKSAVLRGLLDGCE